MGAAHLPEFDSRGSVAASTCVGTRGRPGVGASSQPRVHRAPIPAHTPDPPTVCVGVPGRLGRPRLETAVNLQTERPRTYRVKLGSGRAAPIAGGLLGSAAPCPQAQERTWAGPRGRVPEKPRSPRATGFQGGEEERKGRRRREEGGEEEEEGEEGVIGRLRCEVSTFPAGETAKPPAVLPAAPGLPGSGGHGAAGVSSRGGWPRGLQLFPSSQTLMGVPLPSSLGQCPLPSDVAPHP